MVLSNDQFSSHVRGPHDFKGTKGKPLVFSQNMGDKQGPSYPTSELIDNSDKQLSQVFHEPGWDMPHNPPSDTDTSMEFHSNLKMDMPSLGQFGHTQR